MEAALQLDGMEDTPEPFRGACPSCGVEVLALEVDGREVVVEIAEVTPAFPCPLCEQVRGRGHRRSHCNRCNDTGMLGEVLPLRGVAVDQYGRAREWHSGAAIFDSEAIHVFHACDPVLSHI